VTDEARATAAAAINTAQATMRAETEAARKELLAQANSIAGAMASRLLGREVSQ
jgi:F0F1-type ATP synthase membrane subunit b/b'